MPEFSLKYAKFLRSHKRGEIMRFIAFLSYKNFLPVGQEFFFAGSRIFFMFFLIVKFFHYTFYLL